MTPYITLLILTQYAAGLRNSNPYRYFLFFIPTVFIIGFRLEVGFDWAVYKTQFDKLGGYELVEFFDQFKILTALYLQEPFFLIIAYFSARFFPTYELMQVSIYLFFMYSTYRLGKVMGVKNVIGAFVIIHLFLLFTLEFSTIRQVIAVSFFNLGLSFVVRKKKLNTFVLAMAAAFTQASAALYYIIQIWTGATSKWTKIAVAVFGVLAVFFAAGGLQLLPVSMLPGFIGFKLQYYISERNYNYNILEQVFFTGVFAAIVYVLHTSRKRFESYVLFISRLVVFLCLVAFMAFWVNTIRNRLMYEIIILTSLLCYIPPFPRQRLLRLFMIASGILFFAISLTKETSLTYIPYQNYLWSELNHLESDGQRRNERLREILLRDF